MSKDVWNMIIHSSEIFEWGHPLHDLDKIVLWIVGIVFVIVLAVIVEMERRFCRWERDYARQQRAEGRRSRQEMRDAKTYSFDRWEDWRVKQQKKGR